MANRAKHAFGALENVDNAISSGKVDAFDILFVKDKNGKPFVGWVDKQGNKVIVDDSAEFAELESQIATKANAKDVIEKMATKADAKDVEAELATKANIADVKAEFATKASITDVETELATKANAKDVETSLATKANAEDVKAELDVKANAADVKAELATKANVNDVEEKIDKVATDTVATAKAYTDGKVEAAVKEHLVKKFEISGTPDGALVNINEREIRIMCPVNSEFAKQSVGTGGDPNCYYATLKTYVFDNNVVGYREHMGSQSDSETLTDLKTDEYGRKYQLTWLALAKYDDATGTWNYYGKNSSVNKYIGWDYEIDWYDANNEIVASDNIRINLSNEECHFVNEPYYVGKIIKDVDTKIEEKIAEVEAAYEVIEF